MLLLCLNTKIFASTDDDLGRTHVVKHTMDTGDARPIKQHAYRQDRRRQYIDETVEKKRNRESLSPLLRLGCRDRFGKEERWLPSVLY